MAAIMSVADFEKNRSARSLAMTKRFISMRAGERHVASTAQRHGLTEKSDDCRVSCQPNQEQGQKVSIFGDCFSNIISSSSAQLIGSEGAHRDS
jgi:hypothetical protein